jgi:hypothetical protein
MNNVFHRVPAPSMTHLSLVAAAVALLFSWGPAAAVSDMSDSIYHIDLDPADINEIQGLLPEQHVNTAFINSAIDPNVRLLEDAEVSLTFIDEGAGYKNSFGYFLFDSEENILETKTIFSNASEQFGGGSLTPGDSVDLGVFEAGTNIGFWLQGNGFNDPNGYTYYTLDHLNPDGLRHVAMIADLDNERIVLGVEDLFNLGDQDFNDIVFTFTASPFSALDISTLPTGAPEAGPIATALICASLFGAYARRRNRSPSHGLIPSLN